MPQQDTPMLWMLVAGMLLTFPCAQAHGHTDPGIVITEIMYHARGPDANGEYLELYNNTAETVDVGGWSFAEAIDFVLPVATLLEPDAYLVIARDSEVFHSLYPDTGIQFVGGYAKKLNNGGETIQLLNALGEVVDEVTYGDDSPWPQAADGEGPSLELTHPALDNSHAKSWAASQPGGTPGVLNSVAQSNPAPIVEVLHHAPVVPGPASAVTVTAWITDDAPPVQVELFHRAGSGAWASVPMDPDPDPAVNRQWRGTLPVRPQGAIVEFYVRATDTAGQFGYGPLLAPQQNSLYQVDAQVHTTAHETYRVVLTEDDFDWLFARNPDSDELLNCTFMAGPDIRYNAGLRFRGNSSRVFPPPKNLRVQFTWADVSFRGLNRLNLNGVDDDPRNSWDMAIASHEMGHDFLDRAQQLTLDHQLVSLVTNNQFWPNYIYLSAIDNVFAQKKFPGDDGNLYRCITHKDPHYPQYKGAELDYRGTDPDAYRPNYYKRTNEAEDDWSDLIRLADTLNNTPDEDYARCVREIVDVEQWMGFFAALNLISYQEGGIHAGQGTEYSMYRRESDGRFVMIPWDMDENFRKTNQPLLTQSLPAVKRFIRHPDHIDLYYAAFRRLLDGPFSEDQMQQAMERYRGVLPQEFLEQVKEFVTQRRAYVLAHLPQ